MRVERCLFWNVDAYRPAQRWYRLTWLALTFALLSALLLATAPARAGEVEKVLFLVVDADEVIASNTVAGRFDRLELRAKERIVEYKVAEAVAVVVTNQRYVAYGVVSGAWQSIRVQAGEKTESMELADYSATVVTSDRILNFYGRSGAWNETRR